ncbi:MAG: universal stress protein [Pseudomonadota bacterium]
MTATAFHTMIVPVRGDGKGDNVLAHAAVLAHRFGARIKVVHCHPRPDDLMPYGVVIPRFMRQQIEEAMERNVDVTKDQLLAEFRELARQFGLAETAPVSGTATAEFIEYEGKQVDAVRHFGRLSDLICVPQPDKERNLGANTLKSALFSSGRPVMMCPHADPVAETFVDHVAIGWNGSLEASRAVALANPLIEAAKDVTVLTTGDTTHSATAEELRQYLEIRGVSATIHKFEARGSVVGAQLLEQCAAIGAGTLVMGAYHESFERETVFGGNSQAVVETAKIPVILVH